MIWPNSMISEVQGLSDGKDDLIRMDASHALALVGSTSSLELICNAFYREQNAAVRNGMQRDFLALLPTWYQNAPGSQAGQMIAEAENLLSADLPLVRMDAADALARIGPISSTEDVRAAILRESLTGGNQVRICAMNPLMECGLVDRRLGGDDRFLSG